MPTKTLYVKDQQLWEKAGRLAGHQKLSEVIMQLLAKWVADKENHEAIKSGKEFTEIELCVGGDEHSRWHPRDPIGGDYKVAFTGRLLASTERGPGQYLSTNPIVEVYELSDRRLVVYRDFESSTDGATCLVYSDVQRLRDNPAALETLWWVDDSEEKALAVPPFRTRTARGEQGTEDPDEDPEVEREAYDLDFLNVISDALGAEMIVRID